MKAENKITDNDVLEKISGGIITQTYLVTDKTVSYRMEGDQVVTTSWQTSTGSDRSETHSSIAQFKADVLSSLSQERQDTIISAIASDKIQTFMINK